MLGYDLRPVKIQIVKNLPSIFLKPHWIEFGKLLVRVVGLFSQGQDVALRIRLCHFLTDGLHDVVVESPTETPVRGNRYVQYSLGVSFH